MKKLLFGIVCFRENFAECDSFLSLLKSYRYLDPASEINIFIFDNTDLENWVVKMPFSDHRIILNYVHFNSNPGISFAYNYIADFAKKNEFDWIVFLDQDSALPENVYEIYEEFALNNSEGIAAPSVIVNHELFSPSHYKHFRTSTIKNPDFVEGFPLKNITCINSGMMIGVKSFFLCGGYSNQLRIDFCDHEFIERVGPKLKYLHLLKFEIHQNFSAHTNDLSKAIFRYSIFLKDLKAYRKIHHNSFVLFVLGDLATLLRLTLQYKDFGFMKVRWFSKNNQKAHNKKQID